MVFTKQMKACTISRKKTVSLVNIWVFFKDGISYCCQEDGKQDNYIVMVERTIILA